MSATACVSAAEPDRQHHIVSCTCVSLSVTRFAMYAPVVVLLSAPRMTPSLKLTAMLTNSQLSAPSAPVMILRAYGSCLQQMANVHCGTETERIVSNNVQ